MANKKAFSIQVQGKIPTKELFRKKSLIGLDSNVLVDCALAQEVTNYIIDLPISKRGIFYTTNKNIEEVKDVLRHKHKYSRREAKAEVDDLLKKMKIKIGNIKKDDKKLGFSYMDKYKEIGAHLPDAFIIANFKNNHISDVFSTDNRFLDVARAVGLHPRKIPTTYKIFEEKMKSFKKYLRR